MMRIYYVHPAMLGPLPDWPPHLRRCRDMGFDHVASALLAPGSSGDVLLVGDHEAVHPVLQAPGPADDVIHELCDTCRKFDLKLIIDLVLDRIAVDAPLARPVNGWFQAHAAGPVRLDPRFPLVRTDAAHARFNDPVAAKELADWWVGRIERLLRAGVAGFRCEYPHLVPAAVWQEVIGRSRRAWPKSQFLAWTPGMEWPQISALRGLGFDGVFSSLPWWDGRASWFVQEREILRQVSLVLACPEAPFGPRLAQRIAPTVDRSAAYRHAVRVAVATGDGLLIPAGFEFASAEKMRRRDGEREALIATEPACGVDLRQEIVAANSLMKRLEQLGVTGETRTLTGPGSPVTALLRVNSNDARNADAALLVLINPDLHRERRVPIALDPLPPAAGNCFEQMHGPSDTDAGAALGPGEVRLIHYQRGQEIRQRRTAARAGKLSRTTPRIAVEKITPAVNAGRFAVKRVIGERLTVEADVFADGHELLAVELIWKAVTQTRWRRVRMRSSGNDRWQAVIAPTRVGRYVYAIEAWWDEYETFCRDIQVKHEAGTEVKPELEEGRELLRRALERADAAAREELERALESLEKASSARKIEIFLSERVRELMRQSGRRRFRYEHRPMLPLEIERPQALFSSWYELFPRSATDDPRRHGTFEDVIKRLPIISGMGFDVLYFPPIHPIGMTNRKGRNNALRADADDVGSPYAIGSAEGGHDSINPALGTIEDFRRLRDAAAEHGLEIALDFAIQCSPDHPWLKQHPQWFRWRPDGSVRFAENPPKKYEDILNVDFYADHAIPDLWIALRDVVLYWVSEGIRTFRVDNPHTKPLPFWEWLIADVRARNPAVIFLSEAFTRPKMMYRLAKVGFSQSYTYFTWRNTKRELTDYLVELTTSDVREYFRPHLFVNTPDINPLFLQTSGRPGFLIRAALAATMSGLWGMFSGFELCESSPLPGREEYLDSDKYELRARDPARPGNIMSEIATLNRIRKANPALQTHLGIRFYNAFNDQIIYYGKASPAPDDIILVAVNLDPRRAQEATIEVPLWEWGLPDSGSVLVDDLMRDTSFVWSGKLQQIRLDPSDLPFAIWRIAPAGRG